MARGVKGSGKAATTGSKPVVRAKAVKAPEAKAKPKVVRPKGVKPPGPKHYRDGGAQTQETLNAAPCAQQSAMTNRAYEDGQQANIASNFIGWGTASYGEVKAREQALDMTRPGGLAETDRVQLTAELVDMWLTAAARVARFILTGDLAEQPTREKSDG